MADRKLIRIARIPLLPEEEHVLRRVHEAEQAGRASRVPPPKLEAMAARGLVIVVHHPRPILPRARVTRAGAIQLDLDPGNRS